MDEKRGGNFKGCLNLILVSLLLNYFEVSFITSIEKERHYLSYSHMHQRMHIEVIISAKRRRR